MCVCACVRVCGVERVRGAVACVYVRMCLARANEGGRAGGPGRFDEVGCIRGPMHARHALSPHALCSTSLA